MLKILKISRILILFPYLIAAMIIAYITLNVDGGFFELRSINVFMFCYFPVFILLIPNSIVYFALSYACKLVAKDKLNENIKEDTKC